MVKQPKYNIYNIPCNSVGNFTKQVKIFHIKLIVASYIDIGWNAFGV